MEIREATAADVDRLVAMALQFLEATRYGELLGRSPDALRTLIEVVLEHGVGFVAEAVVPVPVGFSPVSVQLVGMIGVVAVPHPMNGRLYCDELVWWVEPGSRYVGVGPALKRAVEAWARSKNCSMIKMVAPAGSRVGRFLEHDGYEAYETAYFKVL